MEKVAAENAVNPNYILLTQIHTILLLCCEWTRPGIPFKVFKCNAGGQCLYSINNVLLVVMDAQVRQNVWQPRIVQFIFVHHRMLEGLVEWCLPDPDVNVGILLGQHAVQFCNFGNQRA